MARLPDETALGAIDTSASRRPIATYDTTGIARGAAAIAGSVQDLGQAIAGAGRQAASIAERDRRADEQLEDARAGSSLRTDMVDLQLSLDQDKDHATLPGRFTAKALEIQERAAGFISDPRRRELFKLRTQDDIARGNAWADQKALGVWKDETTADTITRLEKIRQQALQAPDRETAVRLIDDGKKMIGALAEKGIWSREHAVTQSQEWSVKYATGWALSLPPEERIRELRQPVTDRETLLDRFKGAENATGNPAAKASTSSAMGDFQFIKETWLRTVRARRPDLLEGRSEKQVLALRADPKLSREMAGYLMDANTEALNGAGLQPTPANLYLAHFLGAGDAIKVLRAKPGTPVEGLVDGDSVKANRSILEGKTTDTVIGWAGGKMGGPGAGRVASLLPHDTRTRLLHDAEREVAVAQRTRTADMLTTFRGRLSDTRAEALTTGSVSAPMTADEFTTALGEDAGAREYAAYQADLQLGRDLQTVAGLDSEEQAALLDKHAPKPGTEGYAEQLKNHAMLEKAIAQSNAAKAKDPAAFALTRLPVVKDAYAALQAAQTPDDRRAAARSFATKMEMEQARIGVPAAQRRLLPKEYIDNLNARLSNPKAEGGAGNVAAAIEAEAAMWGEAWPQVYRQLARSAAPTVAVIGSGVTPAAAQILTEFATIKLGDIANDQSETKLAEIRAATRSAFGEFVKSMAGNEGSQPVVDAFQAAGEKLTAFYVRGGETAAKAGTRAFNELLGHKYSFEVDSDHTKYRVPLDISVTPAQVTRGVEAARWMLRAGEIDVAPARDRAGGLSQEYLSGAPGQKFARDGVWVTAPDESGLALVFNDQAVRRADGKPLILTWDELARIGRDAVGREAVGAWGVVTP
jgi:hypothetical protein